MTTLAPGPFPTSNPIGGVMFGLLVLALVVGAFVMWRRGKSRKDTATQLLVSRDDRTASFSRRPGRLRGRSGL